MSISARRSLWNVQIVVARSLLKRRYSVWQCGGLTPKFVRGKIFIIFAFNFIFWAQISRDACGKDKKRKKKEKRWGGGYPTFTHQADFF